MLEHFKLSDDEAIRVSIDSLRSVTEEIFIKCGVSEKDAKLGADVATVPPKFLKSMYNHPLTDRGLSDFLSDWKKTGQSIL